jgi:hypothetical protein
VREVAAQPNVSPHQNTVQNLAPFRERGWFVRLPQAVDARVGTPIGPIPPVMLRGK